MRTRLRSGTAGDLLWIGGLSFVLRLAWIAVYGRTAPGPNDTIFYLGAADGLARGHGFVTPLGQPSAHWPPGFPFLVSLLYRVFGEHPWLGLALNLVLGTASALIIYAIATRMFGRGGGRVAGALFAILPGSVFFTGLWLSETTFIFMLLGFLALVIFLPDRLWVAAALGVACGLVALTRGEGLLLPVIPLAVWWGAHGRADWGRRAALFVLFTVLTIAPWTIRNQHVMHAFVPVATNPSTTLWSGHNDSATGGPTYAPASLLARIAKVTDSRKHEVAEANLLRHEAIHWMTHHPLGELSLIPRKLVALNDQLSNVFPIWFNAKFGPPQAGPSGMLLWGTIGDALSYALLALTLASLGLVGPRRLWRAHAGMRGVFAYLAICLFSYGWLYYGQFRYRVPMEPFMILIATPLVLRVWAARRLLRDPAPQAAPA